MSMTTSPKIVTLLASPRLDGVTAQLLKAAENRLYKEGIEVTRIHVSTLNFKACCACMKCRTDGICSLPFDDAYKVGQHIRECDGLIVASPTYLGDLPGETKMLLDRLVSDLMDSSRIDEIKPRPLHKGKPIGVIVTSSAMWPFNILSRITDTAGTLRRIFSPAGFKFVATTHFGNTKQNFTLTKARIAKAEKMSLKVASKAQKYFAQR